MKKFILFLALALIVAGCLSESNSFNSVVLFLTEHQDRPLFKVDLNCIPEGKTGLCRQSNSDRIHAYYYYDIYRNECQMRRVTVNKIRIGYSDKVASSAFVNKKSVEIAFAMEPQACDFLRRDR